MNKGEKFNYSNAKKMSICAMNTKSNFSSNFTEKSLNTLIFFLSEHHLKHYLGEFKSKYIQDHNADIQFMTQVHLLTLHILQKIINKLIN